MTEDVSIIKENPHSDAQRDARVLSRVFQRMSERLRESTGNPIITFSCNHKFGYYCEGVVRIDCLEYPLEHWLDNYEEICNKIKANKEDIENCKIILNILNDFKNKKNK